MIKAGLFHNDGQPSNSDRFKGEPQEGVNEGDNQLG
jgi:hypothetical protein